MGSSRNHKGFRRIMVSMTYLLILLCGLSTPGESEVVVSPNKLRLPSVVIAILARNKAHTLPFFLTSLENLDYPKSRISLWIRSDHNEDGTLDVLKKWLNAVQSSYHSANVVLSTSLPKRLPDEKGPAHWSPSRFAHVISLREEALQTARNLWADYIWFLDCDTFIINNQTLRLMMSKELTVVAPMLKSDGMYANFWCGMTEDYYYMRTDEYKPILHREKKGCFEVPMVHSSVLIDLRREASMEFSFKHENLVGYDGPNDDIIVFALSVKASGTTLNVCNDEIYGYIMVPLEEQNSLVQDLDQLTNLKMEIMVNHPPLAVSPLLEEFVPQKPKDKMGVDEVYMINLLRRPTRRERMNNCFDELGLLATPLDAVDGSAPNCSNSSKKGVRIFRFPSDPKRRAAWLINCRRDKWTPSTTSYLCEVHFTEEQFESRRQDGRKLLKQTAIPTVFSFRHLSRAPAFSRAPPKSRVLEEEIIGGQQNGPIGSENILCNEGELVEEAGKYDSHQDEVSLLMKEIQRLQAKVLKLTKEKEEMQRKLEHLFELDQS